MTACSGTGAPQPTAAPSATPVPPTATVIPTPEAFTAIAADLKSALPDREIEFVPDGQGNWDIIASDGKESTPILTFSKDEQLQITVGADEPIAGDLTVEDSQLVFTSKDGVVYVMDGKDWVEKNVPLPAEYQALNPIEAVGGQVFVENGQLYQWNVNLGEKVPVNSADVVLTDDAQIILFFEMTMSEEEMGWAKNSADLNLREATLTVDGKPAGDLLWKM